jgi:uncharacterized protein
MVTLLEFGSVLLVLVAGVGGGLAGSIAGLASAISYPLLLVVGLPPVVANMCNTVALVAGGIGAMAGSRRELRTRGLLVAGLMGVAAVGGLVGALVLVLAPAESFERIVPLLVGTASLLILLPTPRSPRIGPADRRLYVGTAGVAVYGGYFGAAAGVIMLAMLQTLRGDDVRVNSAIKNACMAAANAVAAATFLILRELPWNVVLPLALGFLIGGRLGPIVIRWLPPGVLKAAIAVAGLGLALALAVHAYG